MNGWEVVAVLVSLNGCSHGVLLKKNNNIKQTIKRVLTQLMLSRLVMIVWPSHLEELEQHVVEVGGDVHDADGWVLLTCRETESLLLQPV